MASVSNPAKQPSLLAREQLLGLSTVPAARAYVAAAVAAVAAKVSLCVCGLHTRPEWQACSVRCLHYPAGVRTSVAPCCWRQARPAEAAIAAGIVARGWSEFPGT